MDPYTLNPYGTYRTLKGYTKGALMLHTGYMDP